MHNSKKLNINENLLKQAESKDAWIWSELNDAKRNNYSAIRGAYPFYASKAKGAYFWDVDGNKYIDFMLGYGTILLGHADDRVVNAVCKEIQCGHMVSPLWKPQQKELVELLISIIPNAEMAYLMKTGSDAASGAIRLARIFTGRDKVIRWGYNGWHDWATPRPAGVPSSVRKDIFEFVYNDLDSLHNLFKIYGNEIACVFMMPFELEKPKEGFLQEVKEMAHKYGALFILDEMRSGFRMALGGAQESFNITADLATYSKAMSNGFSISTIVGRADILKKISQTKMTATYFCSSAEMVAAITTIKILQKSTTLNHIWEVGQLFLSELEKSINENNISANVLGYPPFPFIQFTEENLLKRESIKIKFYSYMAENGIYFHPNHHWYICGAHSEHDIMKTIEICNKGFQLLNA